jgi:thioredoxin 1
LRLFRPQRIYYSGKLIKDVIQRRLFEAGSSVLCQRRNMAGQGIFDVTDATFDQEVLQSEQPVLVDFWAAWCGPCKALGPVVDQVAAQYAGQLKVAKMDVDRNNATPMRYGIRGIPALLLFKGGKVADQIVGYVPKETIEKSLSRHITASAPATQAVASTPAAQPSIAAQAVEPVVKA